MRVLWLMVLGPLSLAVPASGQQRSAIVVLVRNSTTQAPLANARVTLSRPGQPDTVAVTDAGGRHVFQRLRPGSYTVQATYQELVSHPATLRLADREQLEVEFAVGPRPQMGAQGDTARLPEVAVEAPHARDHMRKFDERRATGLGQYLTREDIERRPAASTLGDLLRGVRGVRLDCRGSLCTPMMVRAPPRCPPLAIVDESEVDAGFIARILPADIEGVEVYNGLSQAPLDFVGDMRYASCGVIVVWTRRPGMQFPDKPKPPPPPPPPGAPR